MIGTAWADSADEFTSLAEHCREVRNSMDDNLLDRVLVRTLAFELGELAAMANTEGTLDGLLPTLNEEAADCVASARQIALGVAFDSERNRYVIADALGSQGAWRQPGEEMNAALDVADEAAINSPRAERLDALERQVRMRARIVCDALTVNDPGAASRNPLCKRILKENWRGEDAGP